MIFNLMPKFLRKGWGLAFVMVRPAIQLFPQLGRQDCRAIAKEA
jgi:hypothetical protein